MGTSNYSDICNEYKSKLENSFQNDAPLVQEFAYYSDPDFLGNTIFLKQAQNFSKLGKTAMIALKPILLFDAENQIFAFFMNSIFHFNGPSQEYGLELSGDIYENIGIEFKKSGFFQRVINTYAILGCTGAFSPFKRTTDNKFEKLDEKFDFTKTPTISLRKLIEIKNASKPDPPGFIFDQIDFLFLFLASSLAKYKPELWHPIVNGEFGDEIIYFKQAFNRFETLSTRLIGALFSFYRGQNDSILHGLD